MIKLTPEQEAYLRAAWFDEKILRADIAATLDCWGETVTNLAHALGLGDKPCRSLKWPPEKVEELKKLFAEGLSYRQIGMALAVSRNGVAGMIFRLGLANTRVRMQPKPRRAPRPKATAQARNTGGARKVAAIRAAITFAPKPKAAPVEPPVREVASLNPKPWLERAVGECAYPVSGEGADTLSCCNPCGEATYCRGHARIMFVPAKDAGKAFVRGVAKWAA